MARCCAWAMRRSFTYHRLSGLKVAVPTGRHALIRRDSLRRIVL